MKYLIFVFVVFCSIQSFSQDWIGSSGVCLTDKSPNIHSGLDFPNPHGECRFVIDTALNVIYQYDGVMDVWRVIDGKNGMFDSRNQNGIFGVDTVNFSPFGLRQFGSIYELNTISNQFFETDAAFEIKARSDLQLIPNVLGNTGLRFYDNDNSNYIKIVSPSNAKSNYTIFLPDSIPNATNLGLSVQSILNGNEVYLNYTDNTNSISTDSCSDLNIANVKCFGATGDGVTDDTQAIRDAISTKKEVILTDGIYLCDTIQLRNEGQIIRGIGNVEIRQLTSLTNTSPLLKVLAEDIHLKNLKLVGDIENQTSEQSHGIQLSDSANNIIIENVKGENLRGDFIYIGAATPPQNVYIKNCRSRNVYRWGIAITAGENIIIENFIADSTGLGGIDLESSGLVENVKIINCDIPNFVSSGSASGSEPNIKNVEITNTNFNPQKTISSPDYGGANQFASEVIAIRGTNKITFDNCKIIDPVGTNVVHAPSGLENKKIVFNNLELIYNDTNVVNQDVAVFSGLNDMYLNQVTITSDRNVGETGYRRFLFGACEGLVVENSILTGFEGLVLQNSESSTFKNCTITNTRINAFCSGKSTIKDCTVNVSQIGSSCTNLNTYIENSEIISLNTTNTYVGSTGLSTSVSNIYFNSTFVNNFIGTDEAPFDQDEIQDLNYNPTTGEIEISNGANADIDPLSTDVERNAAIAASDLADGDKDSSNEVDNSDQKTIIRDGENEFVNAWNMNPHTGLSSFTNENHFYRYDGAGNLSVNITYTSPSTGDVRGFGNYSQTGILTVNGSSLGSVVLNENETALFIYQDSAWRPWANWQVSGSGSSDSGDTIKLANILRTGNIAEFLDNAGNTMAIDTLPRIGKISSNSGYGTGEIPFYKNAFLRIKEIDMPIQFQHPTNRVIFDGSVVMGDAAVLVPSYGEIMGYLDFNTDEVIVTDENYGNGGKEYMDGVPLTDSTFLIVGHQSATHDIINLNDLTEDSVTKISHNQGDFAFSGAATDSEIVVFAPNRSDSLQILDIATNQLYNVLKAGGTGIDTGFGIMYADGYFWMFHREINCIVKVDVISLSPLNVVQTLFAVPNLTTTNGLYFNGGAYYPVTKDIYLSPAYDGTGVNENGFYKFNVDSGEFTFITAPFSLHAGGDRGYGGATYDGFSIWMAPLGASQIAKIDPYTDTVVFYDVAATGVTTQDRLKFRGAIATENKIYFIPHTYPKLLRISIPELGTEKKSIKQIVSEELPSYDHTTSSLISNKMYVDIAMLNDAVINNIQIVSGGVTQNATFTGHVSVSVSGNSIAGAGNGTWGSSGASTNEFIAGAEDGHVSFRAEQTDKRIFLGLSYTDTDANFSSIDYALFLTHTGEVRVYELGANIGTFSTYNTTDIFKVEKEGTIIKYYKNTTLLYTSTIAVQGSVGGQQTVNYKSRYIEQLMHTPSSGSITAGNSDDFVSVQSAGVAHRVLLRTFSTCTGNVVIQLKHQDSVGNISTVAEVTVLSGTNQSFSNIDLDVSEGDILYCEVLSGAGNAQGLICSIELLE